MTACETRRLPYAVKKASCGMSGAAARWHASGVMLTGAAAGCCVSGAAGLCGAIFTLISFFIIDLPRLKHAKRIFRWPGLRPSTADGIERTLSALEKWISS